MKVLTYMANFAKNENIQFFFKPLLTGVMTKCSPFGDLTNIFHHLKLLSIVRRLRYVHHSQATPISYTFLVADYN